MKIKEESFWKFVVACIRTGNKELAKKLIKQIKGFVSAFHVPCLIVARPHKEMPLETI